MNKKTTILFGTIIMAAIVASVMSFGIADSISTNNLDRKCMTAEQSKQVSTFIKIPTDFPENYSVKCVAINDPRELSMIISDKPVTTDEWLHESLNPSGTNIYLHQVDESQYLSSDKYNDLGSPEQRIRDTIADIQKQNPKLKPIYYNINGMPAYGIDSCSDCGIQTADFGDGNVITKTYDVPSKLKIIGDNGVRYSFYGNVSLDDLVKLGNSLK